MLVSQNVTFLINEYKIRVHILDDSNNISTSKKELSTEKSYVTVT